MKNVEAQFTAAYNDYGDEIFRFCHYRVFDRERAKDLTQETFIKTWKQLADGVEIKNVRAWLYKVARNLVIDNSRKKTAASLEDMAEAGFEPVAEKSNHHDIIDGGVAIELLQKLDPIYRDVLLLRFVHDFSPKEIAEQLQESQNVISVRINRGLKQLKILMK